MTYRPEKNRTALTAGRATWGMVALAAVLFMSLIVAGCTVDGARENGRSGACTTKSGTGTDGGVFPGTRAAGVRLEVAGGSRAADGPMISILTPDEYTIHLDNVLNSKYVNVEGTAFSHAGIEKVEVSVNGLNWEVAEGLESWSYEAVLPEGESEITVRVRDRNDTVDSASVRVKVDLTSPERVTGLSADVGYVSGEVRLSWDRWGSYDYENGTISLGADRHHLIIYVSEERPGSLSDMQPYEQFMDIEDWSTEVERLPWIHGRDLSNLTNGKKYWFAVTAVDRYGNENDSLSEDVNLVWAVPVKPPDAMDVFATFALPALILFVVVVLAYLFAPGRAMKRLRERTRDALRPYAYVAPAVGALALLTFYPVGYGFYLSFTNMDKRHLFSHDIIGFDHYVRILTQRDAGLWDITVNTFAWTFSNVLLTMAIGLFLALVLNRKRLRGKLIYRTLLLLPWAMPAYIGCLIWKGMFNYEFGAINHVFRAVGADPIPWLTEMPYAFWACVITNVWLGVPFMVMVFSGGLASIPQDLYEAARVDGVSSWMQFKRITVPLLKPTIIPASLLSFIWTFNMFNVIYLITGGGPGGKTDILITYVYEAAFGPQRQYGFAAAYSVIIFFMLLGFSVVYMRINRAEGDK